MLRKIINISLWSFIVCYLIVIMSFVGSQKAKVSCIAVEVTKKDTLHDFVKKNDVLKMIYDNGEKLQGYAMDSINLASLEKLVSSHPAIKRAEVYKKINGKVYLDIYQRNPIVRIVNIRNESCYIDEEGVLMPVFDSYSAHVPIVSGNVPVRFSYDLLRNKDVRVKSHRLLIDIYQIAIFVYEDKFWSSQIEQIYVNTSGDIELIPKVGRQTIILGNSDDLETKFANLYIIYKEAFKYTGWNKYNKINLKYSNQVICTKK